MNEMPDTEPDVVVDGLRKLSVGRITYLVIAAIPVAIFLRLLLDPGETKDERFSDFLQRFLMLIVDIPVVLVGLVILIRSRLKRFPLRFWIFAVLFAALPILFGVFAMMFESVLNVHVRPFT